MPTYTGFKKITTSPNLSQHLERHVNSRVTLVLLGGGFQSVATGNSSTSLRLGESQAWLSRAPNSFANEMSNAGIRSDKLGISISQQSEKHSRNNPVTREEKPFQLKTHFPKSGPVW